MSNMNDNMSSPLDQATSARLARLRTMPVDTSGVAPRVKMAIPELQEARTGGGYLRQWISPLRAAAAILVVVGTILAVILAGSGGAAIASIDQLAQLHEETITDQHATRVATMEAASAALNKEWPKSPELPRLPGGSVMSCCVQPIGRGKMACVVLTVDGQPVTVAVAKASEVKCPMGTMAMRDGVEICTHTARGISMVMVQKDGQWTCYMGKLPVDRLADLAAKSAK